VGWRRLGAGAEAGDESNVERSGGRGGGRERVIVVLGEALIDFTLARSGKLDLERWGAIGRTPKAPHTP
jgi:hypothetical protein